MGHFYVDFQARYTLCLKKLVLYELVLFLWQIPGEKEVIQWWKYALDIFWKAQTMKEWKGRLGQCGGIVNSIFLGGIVYRGKSALRSWSNRID